MSISEIEVCQHIERRRCSLSKSVQRLCHFGRSRLRPDDEKVFFFLAYGLSSVANGLRKQ
jgi:hypothetical protein